jgi:tRNA uridine 5-carboxymethylaminomethyl modification enzyme
MKTGTSPRVLCATIDFSRCEEQIGDPVPQKFPFYDSRGSHEIVKKYSNFLKPYSPNDAPDSRSCWITYTNGDARAVVQKKLHLSPPLLRSDHRDPPRYCPSIQDKCVKFPSKDVHRLFLEPEGNETDEWYINRLSTSLPIGVQTEILQTIPGLEHAQILRPAQAVKYDCAPPTQLYPSLESKVIGELFCAGQINGTSGYEEGPATESSPESMLQPKSKAMNPHFAAQRCLYRGFN